MAQGVKNPSVMQETQVQPLDQEDPLEKEMATHSSILAWKIRRTEEPGRPQSTGSQESDNDLEIKPPTTIVDTGKGIWAIHSEPLRN